MFDMTLFRQPAFVGVSVATFCIAAGMFAMFPYLSIYLQDILGYSPLATGLRFLPLTGFVFLVPLVTRHLAARVPLRVMIGAGLALVAAGLALMYGLDADSGWTALLAGLHRRRHRDRDRESRARGRRSARGGSGTNGDGIGDQQHLPPRRRGRRGRGAGRPAREPRRERALDRRPATTRTPSVPQSAQQGYAPSPVIRTWWSPRRRHSPVGLNDVILAGSLLLVVGALAAIGLLRSPAPASVPVTENA